MCAVAINMDSPPPKILLTNTSTMSLHDRFTSLITNKQAGVVGAGGARQQAASVKNRRLAHQMARRPSVVAALKSKPFVRQRVGLGGVKARLGRPLVRGVQFGKANSAGRPRGRGGLRVGALSRRLAQCGLVQPPHSAGVKGAAVMQNRAVRGTVRGKGRGQTSGVCGGFVGHSWSGVRYRPYNRPVPTREELDAQLDDYMSMSKSYLDAQLDEYMAEVDSQDLL
ncbi:chromatin target of PRMT1 protein-like isoform X2 [Brachyhypopomus gauderio]|uniref:chromatin target of PRMT1 protein-like isoform X2 n=1 Tax=Brachyhypopomus gauderio TaxID=698409 RepID=UPI0040432E5C